MRAVITVAFLGLVACSAVVLVADSPNDAVLAEMKKCAVCKSLAENPKFMSQMTWETHKIDNGMLCVSSVPKESVKEFEALHAKMMQSVDKVKSESKAGKKVELCSFCEGMGSLEKSGAKHQVIPTATGAVSLITSSDPEVVKKIHAQADEAIAMQKKMQSQSQAK
jgi:hypothetical protein